MRHQPKNEQMIQPELESLMSLELQAGRLEDCPGGLGLETMVFFEAHAVCHAQAHQGMHDVVHAGRWLRRSSRARRA